MHIDLPKTSREQAITAIERCFRELMNEPICNVGTGGLLNFFLKKIGPSVYNLAVVNAQERMLGRLQELDTEVQEGEFGYWKTAERGGRSGD